MNKEITIIVPTYKPQAYIYECLNSILSQTIHKDRFELIIVLNGCDEPYRNMIEQYLSQNDSLQARLIQTDVPGVSNARNIGIEHARGENICFIDDDDWVSPMYLEALLTARHGNDSITVSTVKDYDEERNTFHEDYITRTYNRFVACGKASLLGGRSFLSSSCCKMIPRDMIGRHRFSPEFKIGEDSLFMASITDSMKTIILADAGAVYFRRERNVSASRSRLSRAFLVKNMVNTWMAYVKIYLSNISGYNLPFFMTRLVAVTISHVNNIFTASKKQ